MKQDVIQFKSNQLIGGIYFFADIIFYIICVFFIAGHSINIGQYVAIATYFSMVSRNVRHVLHGNVDYQKRKTCVERVSCGFVNDVRPKKTRKKQRVL